MKTLATFFGQNIVSPDHYSGWSGDLGGCVWDATNWSVWATQFPNARVQAIFSQREGQRIPNYIGQFPPFTEAYHATKSEWKHRLTALAAEAVAGDFVIIGNSGHGTKYATLREADLEGEALCMADGLVKDWELVELLALFDYGVRVLVLLDTCFSGGMDRHGFTRAKALPSSLTSEALQIATTPKAPNIKASVAMITASGENQTAGDTPLGGIFTMSAIKVWKDYPPEDLAVVTPRRWVMDMAARMRNYWDQKQQPTLKVLGRDWSENPFFDLA